jgi:hypothetical protein
MIPATIILSGLKPAFCHVFRLLTPYFNVENLYQNYFIYLFVKYPKSKCKGTIIMNKKQKI